MTQPSDDEPVPKLPRGRGIKLTSPEVFRIVLTAVMLVAIIVLTHPCASAVSSFVTSFDNGSGSGSAAAVMPKPDNVRPPEPDDTTYVRLRPGMTDEQVKAAIDEARAKAKAAHAGSAAAAGAAASGTSTAGSAGPTAGSAGPTAGSGAATATGSDQRGPTR